jgi:hypothetical protein
MYSQHHNLRKKRLSKLWLGSCNGGQREERTVKKRFLSLRGKYLVLCYSLGFIQLLGCHWLQAGPKLAPAWLPPPDKEESYG